MCRVLHLSESGYYRWLRNRKKRQLLAVKINAILAKHPDNRNYGVDRVCLALEQDGVDVSRRTVYRVKKEKGWLHQKRVPHGITKAATCDRSAGAGKPFKAGFQRPTPFGKIPHGYYQGTVRGRQAVCVSGHGLLQRRDRHARDARQYEEGAVH